VAQTIKAAALSATKRFAQSLVNECDKVISAVPSASILTTIGGEVRHE
jgi:hypothetical protein